MENRALLRALSVLLSVVSLFMLLCMLAGVAWGEGFSAIRVFLPSVLLGGALFALSFSYRRKERVMLSSRYGYLFVVLAWVCAAVLGALPFSQSGHFPTFADAAFEAMSGFTTTGASVLTDIEALPASLLLWRATTHWLGGMGIVVLTVAIFPLLGISSKSLMEAEAPGPQVDKFSPRLSGTAAILWLIYLGLTVLLVILLLLGGMNLLDAITHAFATMATGGFSTKNTSVAAFDSAYIDIVLTVFMLLAGTNFAIHWKILNGKLRQASRDSEWRLYLAIFALASVLAAIHLVSGGNYASLSEALRYSAFQVASILTTTGFATTDYLLWPHFSQAILFILMFIGGCSGSTGGGVKVGRIFTLFKMALAEMKYLLNPRGMHGIFVNKQYMKKTIVYDIAAMVYLYIFTAVVSTLVVAWGGFDILTSLSATLATLGNIGPGFNLVGPAVNYAFFPDWLKYWFFFVMLIGRLEVYTVLIIFTKSFWR